MMTLAEIMAVIDRLSPREYAELLAMLHPPADDAWDRQIAADAAAGRLDGLTDEARADIAAGRCRSFEDLLTADNDAGPR